MIPIESFEAQSMSGKFVPIVPGGTNIKLTFHNRREYVEKALHFRLRELDEQVRIRTCTGKIAGGEQGSTGPERGTKLGLYKISSVCLLCLGGSDS